MRQRTISKLMGNQPVAMPWALVNLPMGSVLKKWGWKKVETTWDGGFYSRADGLLARCRGVELEGGVRWWHVIVGRHSVKIHPEEVQVAVSTFFPPNAMVLQVHLPDEDQDEEEASGRVVHLWWCVDGNSGVPDVTTWEMEPSFDEPERPSAYED